MWKMLYQGPENSSTPGKLVLPWRKVNVLAICTVSNHKYRLSDPTTVVHITDWLYLNTFPPVEDARPSTRIVLNTCKYGFTVKAIQCSGHVTESHHEYTLSEPTAMAYSPDWLHQNTSPPWSQSGLVWFSINGQNTDLPLWQNRFSDIEEFSASW